MVLKRLFVSDIGEDSYLHIHFSDLPGDGAYHVNMIVLLNRRFVGDTGEHCLAHSLFRLSGRPSSQSECSGVARTNFLQFLLWDCVVVLTRLICDHFYLGSMWWS